MSRGSVLVAASVLALVAGCSGGGGEPPAPAPADTPGTSAPSVSAAPSTPASSPTSSSSVLVPGADCLPGTWRLVRFVGLGDKATYGTGQGGDVSVTFTDGRYNLVGEGQRPITVNLAGQAASLTIDGTVDGTYQPDGAEMAFTIDRAAGEGTLQAGKQEQTLPMESVGQVIAPRGKATLACPGNQLLIALPTVRLEFER